MATAYRSGRYPLAAIAPSVDVRLSLSAVPSKPQGGAGVRGSARCDRGARSRLPGCTTEFPTRVTSPEGRAKLAAAACRSTA